MKILGLSKHVKVLRKYNAHQCKSRGTQSWLWICCWWLACRSALCYCETRRPDSRERWRDPRKKEIVVVAVCSSCSISVYLRDLRVLLPQSEVKRRYNLSSEFSGLETANIWSRSRVVMISSRYIYYIYLNGTQQTCRAPQQIFAPFTSSYGKPSGPSCKIPWPNTEWNIPFWSLNILASTPAPPAKAPRLVH